jgi:hypothetical protein
MAAVEILETLERGEISESPYLRLVSYAPAPADFRRGTSLQRRRAARAKVLQRRRRLGVAVVLLGALTILALPGHTFGATNGAGLPSDLAGTSTLAPGMNYVVQPGDTVNTIAQAMNPTDPSGARSLLVHELGSSVVVPGEHVLIP